MKWSAITIVLSCIVLSTFCQLAAFADLEPEPSQLRRMRQWRDDELSNAYIAAGVSISAAVISLGLWLRERRKNRRLTEQANLKANKVEP